MSESLMKECGMAAYGKQESTLHMENQYLAIYPG
jgi:hypothetical protein